MATGNSFDRGFGPIPCAGCHQTVALNLGERQSFGVYAGVWCDGCWPRSGYRDAVESQFDPMDAGESLEAEPYPGDGGPLGDGL